MHGLGPRPPWGPVSRNGIIPAPDTLRHRPPVAEPPLLEPMNLLLASLLLGTASTLPAPVAPVDPVAKGAAAAPTAEARRSETNVKQRFEELDGAGDHAGVVKLWRENPYQVLYVIDSYLEGSLKRIETEEQVDQDQIRHMLERAIRGARAADEAFGGFMFSDYATAFAGWSPDEQFRFREGQKAYKNAQQSLRSADFEKALQYAKDSLQIAQPLGDWWGMAMALGVLGDAHEALGHYEAALDAHSRARVVNSSLHLLSSEYRNLHSISRCLSRLGRTLRAELVIARALECSVLLEDEAGRVDLLETRLKVEEDSGHHERAEATRKEIAELREHAGAPSARPLEGSGAQGS